MSVGSADFVMEGNTVLRHAGAGMKVQGMSRPLVDSNKFADNLAYGVWVRLLSPSLHSRSRRWASL